MNHIIYMLIYFSGITFHKVPISVRFGMISNHVKSMSPVNLKVIKLPPDMAPLLVAYRLIAFMLPFVSQC